VFVDFTKAFKSLEWDFMLSTLIHFGFNASFIRWVKHYIVIYKHVL